MGFRHNNDTVEIEGRIEMTTAKAILVDTPSAVAPIWLPKSQIVSQTEVGKNQWVFEITEWIAEKNGLS